MQELGTTVYETRGQQPAGSTPATRTYAKGTARRRAVDLLTDIGLLQYDSQAKRFIPVDPSAASDLLVVPLAQQGAELLAESARWNETFSQLGQVFRGSTVSRSRSITEIQGVEAINRFIDTQLTDCRTEFLAAQPYGRRRAQPPWPRPSRATCRPCAAASRCARSTSTRRGRASPPASTSPR